MAPKSVRVPLKEKSAVTAVSYEILAGMDGNPASPKEFDESPHDDDELFFKADEEATEAENNKVKILNFIHKEVHHATERKVPALVACSKSPKYETEIYHRSTFGGSEFDVCIVWDAHIEGEQKNCYAVVKFSSDDDLEEGLPGHISVDANAWNAEAQADLFTAKNDLLVKNYWAPRWKYVVNALRKATYERYEKDGTFIPEPEPEHEAVAIVDDKEEKEEPMDIFAGTLGKFLAEKGALLREIEKVSGCRKLRLPPKNEDGERRKAREVVQIVLIGKGRARAEARKRIQAVVDEWANAPRGPRATDSSHTNNAGDDVNFGGNGAGGGNWNVGNSSVDSNWESGAAAGDNGVNSFDAPTESWASAKEDGAW